jgi:hypothetical protein
MASNVTLPGTGSVIETIDISGVERQVVTIGDRAGGSVDSIGGLTETAPASDTASSGLNGRLQRVAQRITSLIALLPTSLGAGGGLRVDLNPSTTDVAVTPTVTAGAYTSGNVLGGIMTFANMLAATSFNGILQSITAKFKGAVVTGAIEVAIFKASPSNGTYTDKSAPTWSASDMANLLGVYTLTVSNSKLGTMTIYNLDGIGKALVGASQSLYAVAIVDGTPTPASTSDFTLELSVLPG